MTRLPSDSFLPSGSLDNEMHHSLSSDSASSVISPLALPRSVAATSYFDQRLPVTTSGYPFPGLNSSSNGSFPSIDGRAANGKSNANHPSTYSPLSPGLRGPPRSQPPQFLSPHLAPTTASQLQSHMRQRQPSTQRSASLSPTRRAATRFPAAGRTRTRSAMVSPSPAARSGYFSAQPIPGLSLPGDGPFGQPDNAAIYSTYSSTHPRSDSDPAHLPPNSPHMVELLVKQNGRLREAWEAERKYLQANRERAEEVYREERALMDEERMGWVAERAMLIEELTALKRELNGHGGAVHHSHSGANGDHRAAGHTLRGGGGWETSPESFRSSQSSQGNGPSYRNGGTSTLASVQESGIQEPGPSRSYPGFNQGQQPVHASSAGNHQHHSAAFVVEPLSLNFAPASASAPTADGTTEETPVPSVDIHEIHPDLEGIPIKSRAIKPPTFTATVHASSADSSRLSSGKPSPPIDADKNAAPPLDRRPSKERTLQMLAAAESDRLVMHAGHTPNHSMSFLPTAESSEIATTASSNGSTTPTLRDEGSHPDDSAGNGDGEPLYTHESRSEGKAPATLEASAAATGEDHATSDSEQKHAWHGPYPPDPPDDDVAALREPLMVRNMPAHDEIFFRRLSDKLEGISRGEDAVPKALRGALLDGDGGHTGIIMPPGETLTVVAAAAAPTGSDGAADVVAEKKDGDHSKSDDDDEEELPLKLKKSNNFGAPFGEYRR